MSIFINRGNNLLSILLAYCVKILVIPSINIVLDLDGNNLFWICIKNVDAMLSKQGPLGVVSRLACLILWPKKPFKLLRQKKKSTRSLTFRSKRFHSNTMVLCTTVDKTCKIYTLDDFGLSECYWSSGFLWRTI